MLDSIISNIKYYIKKDGVLNEVNKEEYILFKEKMEKLNKFYLCPHCKVCTCEKIRYSDINVCEEVNTSVYKLLEGIYKNPTNGKHFKKTEVDEFEVYDCDKFELYSNLAINKDGKVDYKKTIERENKEESNKSKSLTNKEILQNVRNRVKEENEKKLAYQLNN